jgi:diguanylate cyclase (GGDEF)-like protein
LKRPTDTLARYGGEEFVVILPDTTNAHFVAETCRTAIEKLEIPHEKSAISNFVTISVGLRTVIPTPDLSPEEFLSSVDETLYIAKKEGRNRTIENKNDLSNVAAS